VFSWPKLIAAVSAVIIIAALGTLFLPSRPSQVDLHPIPRQNVLLVTIDTLRADALGSYGGAASTPGLDRLAAEGVRFDFAHAHAVLTLPSHASILTGQYPFQHGLRDNSGYRLPPSARTAATLLKSAGYATAAFVAAFPVHSRFGLNQGFDLYDDRVGETRAPTEFVMPERPAWAVVPRARQWISARGAGRASEPGGAGESDAPWFVWLHLFDPHAPYRPLPPFDAQYAGRPYYGEVAATDAAVTPLLGELRAAARSTLVIVTGDHGEALGDHGEESHGLFAYESTLRIPLIIAELGGRSGTRGAQDPKRAGEVSSMPARHIDILPTLLDGVGQAIPGDLPGRTLLPAAERRAGAAPRPAYFEAMSATLNRGWAPLTGVLVDGDKYIDLPLPERYDVTSDPAERTNLVGRSVERDRSLIAALRGFKAALPGERQVENADAVARLRSLGYVSGSAPAKAHYTEADDPKRLVAIDRDVHQAVEAFGSGRLDDAARIYQRIIAGRPDMAIAYRHLAFVEWQRGNAAGAIELLQRALQQHLTDPRILTQLGGYLTDTGRIDESVTILEPLAADQHIDALNTLGIAYARAGRRDEARRVFERVLTINKDSAVPLENLGVLALDGGNLVAARQFFERAIRVDPGSSRAHAGLGTAFLRAGDRAAAIDAWTEAVRLDSRNYDALYNLGTTLARDGRLAEARPHLERFLKSAPPALYASDLREVSKLLAGR